MVATASGEIYPGCDTRKRLRLTRSRADKTSFGNAGNGMSDRWSDFRRGVNPPKKVSGSTGGLIP